MDETGLVRKHQNAVLMASRTFFLLDWVKTTDLRCTKVRLLRQHYADNLHECASGKIQLLIHFLVSCVDCIKFKCYIIILAISS